MAAQYNVQVRGGVRPGQKFDSEDFKDIRKAKRQNDEVMILAAAGHFTSGGHYMSIRRVTKTGRLVIDDSNGKGKYGDSERPEGWSARELIDGGIINYRVLHLKGAK